MPRKKKQVQRKDTDQKAIQLAAVHTLLQRATRTSFVYVNHNIDILDPISDSSSEGRSRSSSGLEEEHKYYADLIEKATGKRPPASESDEEEPLSADTGSTWSESEPDEPDLTDVDIRDGIMHELLYGCGPYLMAMMEGKSDAEAPGSPLRDMEEHVKFASYMLKSNRMREYDKYLSELVMHDKLDYSHVLKGKSIKYMLRKAEDALSDTESDTEDSSSSIDSPIDRKTELCTCVVCAKWPGLHEHFGNQRKESATMDRLFKAALEVMEIADEDPDQDFRKSASSEED
jgi:hypothetical protein